VVVSESADFQKGWTTYESGDYATVLRQWTPLAKQGDAVAYRLESRYIQIDRRESVGD
jgi:hypothetical protein